MEESIKIYLSKQGVDCIQLGYHSRVWSSGRLMYVSSNETSSLIKGDHSLKSVLLHGV